MDKQELGENLYALLAQECPLLSGKLTGMILELADVEIHDVINDAEKRGDLVESGVQVLVESVHQGMNADLIPQIQETIRASVVAVDNKEDRDTLLGDKLYGIIKHLEPEEAGKLTGMLLEMDDEEIIRLLCNPPSLRQQVVEAKLVLEGIADDNEAGELAVEEEQLGDQLFMLIQAVNSQKAAKLTGMILELGEEEVKKLIVSPDLLMEKIKEAEDVLDQSLAQE